jgi:hypothetical protein
LVVAGSGWLVGWLNRIMLDCILPTTVLQTMPPPRSTPGS